MIRPIALFPAVGVLLALAVTGARASGPAEAHTLTARVPQTAAAHKWADLIARTEHALGDYVAACRSGEGSSLSRVTTDDLRIEYTLREPGTVIGVDGATTPANCAAIGGIEARTSDLWIFPTNTSVVFIQYDAPASAGAPSQRRLALVEMRGERISRIVNFSTPPEAQDMARTFAGNE